MLMYEMISVYLQEKKRCSAKRSSIRLHSWFEQTNITLEHILLFTYMWINKFSQTAILVELGITSSNYVLLDKFLQRVCEESLKTPDQEQVIILNCEFVSCTHIL